MNDYPEETKAARDPKHIILLHAISDMRSLNEELKGLLEEITGNNQAETGVQLGSEKPHIPSLSDVLEQSPDRIRKSCAEARDLINQIRNVIF